MLNDDVNIYKKYYPQIEIISKEITSLLFDFIPKKIESHIYHLFGFDLIISEDEKVKLLEVNSNCALRNGTMSNVPDFIFREILQDMLNMVVFPITD